MRQNKPPKPSEYITERITVEKLIPGGQGLATLENGKKIFLWNALPGEIITKVQLVRSKSSYAEGIALETEKPSLERVPPRDACYLSTSPWQIMTYAYELEQKRELLQEIFRQHKIDLPTGVEIEPVQTDGRDYFYRNKMEYALYYDHGDQKIHPAFRARGSHQKIIVETSSLERPEIFAAAQAIIDDLNEKHAEARQYQSLLLRANQRGEVSGGLIENHQPRPQFQQLQDTILSQTYSYSPNGFFQINLPVYELALQEIKKHITSEKVLDLYAGVGTIGLSVARDRDLTLVECDKPAYLEMERNCQEANRQKANNQESNRQRTDSQEPSRRGGIARPILAKSEEALDYITPDQTVIVDPPRAGCRPELLEKFIEVRPETIIYLSCNPTTQARDLNILTGGQDTDRDDRQDSKNSQLASQKPQSPGVYEITKVLPFNFFPRTPHLENLVVLKRRSTPGAYRRNQTLGARQQN